MVALGPEARDRETAGDAGVAVCPSGNLANIYFTREPGRLSLEYLVATYPGLVEGLASHPGIGFVLVYSEARGHVVLGPKGYRDLDSETVGGDDPLAHFSPNLAAQLLRISGYDNVGDLLVNSFYDPATGEVAAFEELIGCHGGAGGPQQAPFLMYPAAWTAPAETPGEGAPQLVGADAVHVFLTRHAWQAALPAPTGAPDGASDGARADGGGGVRPGPERGVPAGAGAHALYVFAVPGVPETPAPSAPPSCEVAHPCECLLPARRVPGAWRAPSEAFPAPVAGGEGISGRRSPGRRPRTGPGEAPAGRPGPRRG